MRFKKIVLIQVEDQVIETLQSMLYCKSNCEYEGVLFIVDSLKLYNSVFVFPLHSGRYQLNLSTSKLQRRSNEPPPEPPTHRTQPTFSHREMIHGLSYVLHEMNQVNYPICEWFLM